VYSSTIEKIIRAVDGRLDLNCHPIWLDILPTTTGRQLRINHECVFPSVRWYLRRRLNRAVDKLNRAACRSRFVRYSEEWSIDFNHLEKEQRIPKVIELTESLMQSLRYVVPIIPVPIICAVLLRAYEKPKTSLAIAIL
jgi:hypothetical protein